MTTMVAMMTSRREPIDGGDELNAYTFEPEHSELHTLVDLQGRARGLSRTKLAALAKCCLLALDLEYVSLGDLNCTTDEDPELSN